MKVWSSEIPGWLDHNQPAHPKNKRPSNPHLLSPELETPHTNRSPRLVTQLPPCENPGHIHYTS